MSSKTSSPHCTGLAGGPPQCVSFPEPQNVNLFGKRVIADASSEVYVWSHWSRVGSYSNMAGILVRRKEKRIGDR
jgi:hypothetical protein